MLKVLSSGLIHKIGIITVALTIIHMLEDMALVLIGRYTTIEVWMVLIGTLVFSLVIGLISRLPRVKKFLGG